MDRTETPCHGCKDRRTGCHSADACPKWAAHEQERQDLDTERTARRKTLEVNVGYIREQKQRYVRRMGRKKK